MKKIKITYFAIIFLVITIGFLLWFSQYNKIVGTVHGAEMDKIIIDDVTYIWATSEICPYNGTDKSFHIGKGAWSDGTRILDLYKIKDDKDFNFLYARWGWEGQMYMRESLINE